MYYLLLSFLMDFRMIVINNKKNISYIITILFYLLFISSFLINICYDYIYIEIIEENVFLK